MQKILKKLWDVTTTILVILVFCLAVLLGLPRFINIQPLVVLSGSMEPAFMTGSLVYVQEIDTNQLEVGDVITFYQDDETVVTHRIIEKVDTAEISGGVLYRTKGDANEMEDANLVPPENVIGKAMFAIPYLGYLAQYIQQPPGLYIAIVVGAGLILLMFLPDLFSKEEKKEEIVEKSKEQKNVKTAKIVKKQNGISEESVKKQKAVSEEPAKKKKRPLTEEEKREIIRRRKMREARERREKEQMAKEQKDDEIIIINMNDDDVQEKPTVVKKQSKKQSVKKKRQLTPEEKRELARRRKLYEVRKRELMSQRLEEKEID